MKIRLFAAALAAGAILFGGCTKDASKEIIGSYSYKTSGTLTLVESVYAAMTSEELAAAKENGEKIDTVIIGLIPEQGQMHILQAEGQEGRIIVTFNDILGNADITGGSYSGTGVTLDEGSSKTIYLTEDGAIRLGSGIVSYSGKGSKLEDMLLIDLIYEGEVRMIGTDMTIIESDVHCVAQHN